MIGGRGVQNCAKYELKRFCVVHGRPKGFDKELNEVNKNKGNCQINGNCK